MKSIVSSTATAVIFSLFCNIVGFNSFAQTVSVKDVDSSDAESTTIEIKKGKNATSQGKKEYQIIDDENEVSGEPTPLLKTARENWKKACEDWKKEVREMNKENKVLSANCGKMNCTTATMETTCVSTGKTKIRMLISE